jgi:hypothetical protein
MFEYAYTGFGSREDRNTGLVMGEPRTGRVPVGPRNEGVLWPDDDFCWHTRSLFGFQDGDGVSLVWY